MQQPNFLDGTLSKAYELLAVPAAQGPRHVALHPTLLIAVLADKGSANAKVTIELLSVDGTGLSTVATYEASGPYSPLYLYTAELLFAANGDFAIVSVRDATDRKRYGVWVSR